MLIPIGFRVGIRFHPIISNIWWEGLGFVEQRAYAFPAFDSFHEQIACMCDVFHVSNFPIDSFLFDLNFLSFNHSMAGIVVCVKCTPDGYSLCKFECVNNVVSVGFVFILDCKTLLCIVGEIGEVRSKAFYSIFMFSSIESL